MKQMYVIYDSEMNEIEMTDDLETAEKIYGSMKELYHYGNGLPEEGTSPVTISKVIRKARVSKAGIDNEGIQLYNFQDVEINASEKPKKIKKLFRLHELIEYVYENKIKDMYYHSVEGGFVYIDKDGEMSCGKSMAYLDLNDNYIVEIEK